MSERHDQTPEAAISGESRPGDPLHETAREVGEDTPLAETLHVDRYEGFWMRLSVAILVLFFLAITISGFASGFQVPGVVQRIDPATLYEPGSPFAEPAMRELAPGRYEAYIRAQIWQFTPQEIRVPAGSTVTFYVTSQDVQHGIKIQNTNINMMALPGQVSRLTTTFVEPGRYNFVCHEYCGQLHHTMYGWITVEAPAEEEAAAQARADTQVSSNQVD
jgi:cytochrome c oxidase subunit 2